MLCSGAQLAVAGAVWAYTGAVGVIYLAQVAVTGAVGTSLFFWCCGCAFSGSTFCKIENLKKNEKSTKFWFEFYVSFFPFRVPPNFCQLFLTN